MPSNSRMGMTAAELRDQLEYAIKALEQAGELVLEAEVQYQKVLCEQFTDAAEQNDESSSLHNAAWSKLDDQEMVRRAGHFGSLELGLAWVQATLLEKMEEAERNFEIKKDRVDWLDRQYRAALKTEARGIRSRR